MEKNVQTLIEVMEENLVIIIDKKPPSLSGDSGGKLKLCLLILLASNPYSNLFSNSPIKNK